MASLLGTLGSIGTSLLGDLFTRGAKTIGDVATQKIEKWGKGQTTRRQLGQNDVKRFDREITNIKSRLQRVEQRENTMEAE